VTPGASQVDRLSCTAKRRVVSFDSVQNTRAVRIPVNGQQTHVSTALKGIVCRGRSEGALASQRDGGDRGSLLALMGFMLGIGGWDDNDVWRCAVVGEHDKKASCRQEDIGEARNYCTFSFISYSFF